MNNDSHKQKANPIPGYSWSKKHSNKARTKKTTIPGGFIKQRQPRRRAIVSRYIHTHTHTHIYIYIYIFFLSIYLSMYLCIYLSIYLSYQRAQYPSIKKQTLNHNIRLGPGRSGQSPIPHTDPHPSNSPSWGGGGSLCVNP